MNTPDAAAANPASPAPAGFVEIRVEDLSVMSVQPGDVVLVRTCRPLSQPVLASVHRAVAEFFPGNEVLVLDAEAQLSLLRPVGDAPGDETPHNGLPPSLRALRDWALSSAAPRAGLTAPAARVAHRADLMALAWRAGHHNVSELAKTAGISRTTAYGDLAKHAIRPARRPLLRPAARTEDGGS